MPPLKTILLKLLRRAARRWPRPAHRRYILLDTRSAMAATYLEDLRALLAHDPRLKFYKVARPNLVAGDQRRSLLPVNCPALPYRIAKFFPWDLLVLADHPTDRIDDLPTRFGVLRIPHGIGSKRVHGQDYMYGPAFYHRSGRPRYACVFEASEKRRAQFVAADPAIADIVRLVGDLRIDKLVRTAAQSRLRPSGAGRPTVVIAASWNAGNLLEKIGRDLVDEAALLLDRYAFVIRPHPHFFNEALAGDWRDYFDAQKKRGFVISPPADDLGWVLCAASVVICDDLSSLVLYAAVLDQRILVVPSGNDQIPDDSFPARLRRIVPNLEKAADLRAQLATVLARPPEPGLRALAAEINSRPGESARLVRAEMYRLLALPPLAAAATTHTYSAPAPSAAASEQLRPIQP